MRRLLLVDDESGVLHALKRLLQRVLAADEAVVEIFTDPEAALQRACETEFDVVVSDYRMPSMDGVSFLRCFQGIQPDATRLLLSAATDFDALVTAINEIGLFRYLPKPWNDDDLVAVLRAAWLARDRRLEERRLAERERRNEALPGAAEEAERQRLEAEEPGITQVKWGPDGSVLLDDV